MTDVEKAIKTAERIGNAVLKKFPKHQLFVRRIQTGDNGYIEISLRPDGGSYSQEITTAYSDEFFATATPENIQDKGKRILSDFRKNFGLE